LPCRRQVLGRPNRLHRRSFIELNQRRRRHHPAADAEVDEFGTSSDGFLTQSERPTIGSGRSGRKLASPAMFLFGLSWNEFGRLDSKQRPRDDDGQREKLTKCLGDGAVCSHVAGKRSDVSKMDSLPSIVEILEAANKKKCLTKFQTSVSCAKLRRRSSAEFHLGNPGRNFFYRRVPQEFGKSCPPRRWVIDGLKARVFKIGEQ